MTAEERVLRLFDVDCPGGKGHEDAGVGLECVACVTLAIRSAEADARAKALEEAARFVAAAGRVEDRWDNACTLAGRIRALASKSPEPDSVDTSAGHVRGADKPKGLASLLGKWPGDETDEEVAAALEKTTGASKPEGEGT